jgi:hypothetical protein
MRQSADEAMQVLGQQAVLDKAVLYSLVNRMKVGLGGGVLGVLAGWLLPRQARHATESASYAVLGGILDSLVSTSAEPRA